MSPSPTARSFALFLALWAALAPFALGSCSSTLADKRILQYLNQRGFGKRYVGNAQEQNYVSIGDTIQYVDSYNDEVRGSQVVDIDGTILLPEVGSVWVAGYTRTELESYLTQKLSPYFVETDVKVTIRTGGKKVFYIMGQVRRPGPFPYTGDLTIFEAVLLAYPDEFGANLGRVRLIRADPRDPLIIPVDVSQLWEKGDSTYNLQIQEYDIIYVPPTFLQGVADFISGLLVPLISVFREVFQAIFLFDNPEFFYFRGRRNQNFF
jgi:protein involved in polysaccharide export with SLBB domain